MTDAKPLSTLIAEGWEVVGYSGAADANTGMHNHSILVRRQKQHKVLQIRNKWIGKGLVVTELDL